MPHNRYVRARKIKTDTVFQLRPQGECQWCAVNLRGRQKWWCGTKHRRKFYAYWLSIPKFKREIYLRDDFKCRECGAQPLTT